MQFQTPLYKYASELSNKRNRLDYTRYFLWHPDAILMNHNWKILDSWNLQTGRKSFSTDLFSTIHFVPQVTLVFGHLLFTGILLPVKKHTGSEKHFAWNFDSNSTKLVKHCNGNNREKGAPTTRQILNEFHVTCPNVESRVCQMWSLGFELGFPIFSFPRGKVILTFRGLTHCRLKVMIN